MNYNARTLLIAGIVGLFSSAALSQFTPRAAPEPLVRALRFVPNTPSPGSTTLYATSLGGGMSKGVDDGTTITWQPFATSLPTTRLFSHFFVSDLVFYAMTDGYGLQKTVNGGTTFTAANGSGINALGCLRVRNMSRLGTDTYLGTGCRYDSGLWKSPDDGVTWTRLGVGTIPGDAVVNSFLINTSGTLMIVMTSEHGLFRSIDGGTTWAAANTGMPPSPLLSTPNVFNIQCGTSCATFMLANIHGVGVYKSTDAGLNWTNASTGLPANTPMASGIGRDNTTTPFTYYLATDGQGVYESIDDAATWQLWGNTTTDPTVKHVRNVSRDTSEPDKYYVAKFDGVARTLDGGATWYSSPLGRGTYNSIAHDPQNSATAYGTAATLMKIPNVNAPAPTPLNNGLQGLANDGAVYQFGGAPDTMYVTTNNYGVFKTVDRGLNWAPVNNGFPTLIGQPGRLAFDRVDPQIMYFGGTGNPSIGFYKSSDGGANWYEANTGLTGDARSIGRIIIDRVTPTTLYAATDAGLYKSTNSGDTWSVLYSVNDPQGNPLPVGHVFQGFVAAELYIANSHVAPNGTQLPSSGLLKSINSGTTWTNTLPKRVQNFRLLNGTILVAGLADGPGQPAVMRSADKGVTWQNISAGLTGYDIRGFGTSSDNGATLTATLEDGFFTLNATQSLQFSPSTYTVAESAGLATLTVTRTGGTTGTATVQYESRTNGSATAGSDFTAVTGTLTFAAGIASRTFTIPVTNDTTIEGSETINVRIFNPASPTGSVFLNVPSFAQVTVTDNDNTFQFETSAVEVSETGSNAVLAVTRVGSIGAAATVNWATANGTAMAGQDFGTAASAVQRTGVLSWAAGDGSAKFITVGPTAAIGAYVPILNDATVEGTETFTVSLISATGGTLGTLKQVTVSIGSEDAGVAMALPARTFQETDGAQQILVSRLGPGVGEVDVIYTVNNGTAIRGTHFNSVASGNLYWADGDTSPKAIDVGIVNDAGVNASRTFTVTLTGAVGASVGAPATTTATILDNDTSVQFTTPTITVVEGVAGGNLTLTLARSGILTGPVSVTYTTVDGTGLAGTDFGALGNTTPVTGTVSWLAGVGGNKTFTIPILNDAVVEGAKTFTVQLSDPVGANVSIGTNSQIAVTLNDNDLGLRFEFAGYDVTEGTNASVAIRVMRVGTTFPAATASWATVNGGATSGQDFGLAGNAAARTGTVSWLAGDTLPKTITIPILNDTLGGEGNETFTVTLTPGPGMVIGSPAVATVTIHDNDIPPESAAEFDQLKYFVVEGDDPSAVLTVNRVLFSPGNSFALPASVSFTTQPGSALAASDYTAVSGTLNWAAGNSDPKTITIPIFNNATAESPEQFKVLLSNNSPGMGINTPTATVTILDDDEVFPPYGLHPDDFSNGVFGFHPSNEPGAYEGVYTLKTVRVTDGQTASTGLAEIFLASGTLSFRVKVSSEANFDVLRFYLDGVLLGSWSGTAIPGWQSFSVPLSAGAHTLLWAYEKDGSLSAGEDAAWLDAVTYPPHAP